MTSFEPEIKSAAPRAWILDRRSHGARFQRLGALVRSAARRSAAELAFTFAAAARPEIERHIEAERRCCGFLSFAIVNPPETFELRVSAPPHAADFLPPP
jgi:hypothetical protein